MSEFKNVHSLGATFAILKKCTYFYSYDLVSFKKIIVLKKKAVANFYFSVIDFKTEKLPPPPICHVLFKLSFEGE